MTTIDQNVVVAAGPGQARPSYWRSEADFTPSHRARAQHTARRTLAISFGYRATTPLRNLARIESVPRSGGQYAARFDGAPPSTALRQTRLIDNRFGPALTGARTEPRPDLPDLTADTRHAR